MGVNDGMKVSKMSKVQAPCIMKLNDFKYLEHAFQITYCKEPAKSKRKDVFDIYWHRWKRVAVVSYQGVFSFLDMFGYDITVGEVLYILNMEDAGVQMITWPEEMNVEYMKDELVSEVMFHQMYLYRSETIYETYLWEKSDKWDTLDEICEYEKIVPIEKGEDNIFECEY
jgi:hypothetical protein